MTRTTVRTEASMEAEVRANSERYRATLDAFRAKKGREPTKVELAAIDKQHRASCDDQIVMRGQLALAGRTNPES